MRFADRLSHVDTSAIQALFALLGKPGIISFAGGFPDAAMFDVEGISEAATSALREAPGAVLQYGATEGYLPLREQLAKYMAGKGASVTAGGLIVTSGSQQALDLVAKTLLSPGDRIIVEAPTYLTAIQCFRLYGAQLIGAPVDADGVQVDVLEQLVARHQPRVIYLIPTFGNPSGATLTLERRRRVLELAVRTGTVIVEDDPYGELYFGEAPPPSLLALSDSVPGSREWLVYSGSLSKVLSPGLRIGWMVASAEMLAKAAMCKQFSDVHTSGLAQAVAASYLEAGRMPAALARMRHTYADRAATMGESLAQQLGDAISFRQPGGGLFIWARLTGAGRRGTDASALARRAIDHGVAVVPGTPFYAHDPDLATLRLSFATADRDRIREGVTRLAVAL